MKIRSLLLLAATSASVHAALPVVSNVTSSQRSGTKLVDISYDVADADGDPLKIRVEISSDGGTNYSVPAFTFAGDLGDAVTPGAGKTIVWDAEKDWDGEYSDEMKIRIIASDTQGLPGLAWGNEVPAGGFLMGQDGGAEGGGQSKHVNIPWSFWLSKYEITNAEYAEFLNIAIVSGEVYRTEATAVYANDGIYDGIPANSLFLRMDDLMDIRWSVNKFAPVTGREQNPVSVTWYGALAFAQHYGYDLPTTAEWEKGARGPDHDDEDEHQIYPWGNILSASYANYNRTAHQGETPSNSTYNGLYPYSFASKITVGFFDGSQIPVGPDTQNGYGLYDLIGNVSEWVRSAPLVVEDYPDQESLSYTYNQLANTSTNRVHRGGSEAIYYSDNSSTQGDELKTYFQDSADLDYFSTRLDRYDVHMIGFRVIRRELP